MLSFLITTLAGISTMVGIFPIFMKNKSKNVIIPFSLAFSAGVMLAISIFSLIPEATVLLKEKFLSIPTFLLVAIFIVMGILFSSTIDKKIEEKFTNDALYKLGIISVIVLMLHNIPEGITTFISSQANLSLGITLSLGIALHNIPEGISIAVPIYYATGSKKKAILYTLVSGFSELFGAVVAYFFLAPYITSFGLAIVLAIAAGIMIHISIYELLPVSWSYRTPKPSTLAFILGFIVMLLCDFLM